MPERLTTQLEDGNIERLREMAGGERKVGAFLSEVIAWLWEHRDTWQAKPLTDWFILPIPQTDLDDLRESITDMVADIRQDQARLRDAVTQVREMLEAERPVDREALRHEINAAEELVAAHT